jgi:hypothetical protein
LVDKFWPIISGRLLNGEFEKEIKFIAEINHVDTDKLLKCFESKKNGESDHNCCEIDEDSYRMQEYAVIKKDYGNDNSDLFVKSFNSLDWYPLLSDYFDSISLVYKLKETRAFVGFSRLEPSAGKTIEQYRSMISDEKVSWIPAMQIASEGLFLSFKKSAIESWKKNPIIQQRIKAISKNYNASYYNRQKANVELNPEYILIHTFSHILIAELSKKCGYGSSSIRERLYVSLNQKTEMLGVLLYTSAGDSEGSLGGLVREGKPDYLTDTIIGALQSTEWCSSDPICINSKGQGPDSCNLSACHNCALLPETCCETGNRLLDRGMLIDVSPKSGNGFFQKLLDKVNGT